MTSYEADTRSHVRLASCLNLLTGLGLAASAFIFLAEPEPMLLNNLIVGVVVAVLAADQLYHLSGQAWPSWLAVLAGCWVMMSPWVTMATLGREPSQVMMVTNCIAGVMIATFGCWAGLAENTSPDERYYHADLFGGTEGR